MADDIDAILGPPPSPAPKKPRKVDPRFVDNEPETPAGAAARKFAGTGSYQDVMAGLADAKRRAAGQGDKVASYGLSGMIAGQGPGQTPQAQDPGAGTTFALNATNLFGADPAIGAGLNNLVRGGSYDEWRQKFEAAREAGNEAHPVAKWGGRLAALGAETVVGGVLGKAVGAGAKAVGAGETLAAAAKARPIATAVAKGIGSGAAYGAAGGAGTALSEGKDALEGAESGAKLGGVLGGT